MANRMRFGWASASIDVAGKWLRQARSLAQKKLIDLMRVVVLLLISTAANAQGEMRCAAIHGDACISPEGAAGLLFYQHVRWGLDLMQSATQRDGPTLYSNTCGLETLTTVQSAGPFSFVGEDGYLYEVTYHDRLYARLWSSPGKCTLHTYTDRFLGVDANGSNEHTSCYGAGTACATRLDGPRVVIEPLTLRVGKKAPLPVKVMTGSVPVVFHPVQIQLTPAATNGQLGCARTTSQSGVLKCEYFAPKKAVIETVTATCANCAQSTTATITVTPRPLVFGFFNGVWNTSEQAKDGLTALKALVGPTYRDTPIRYENFYNQTGQGTSSTLLQDIAETFAQRSTELDSVLNNRLEHYWDLLAGRHGDPHSLTGSFISGIGNGAAALAGLIDATFNATMGQAVAGWARMLSNPPTEADMGAQLAKLRGLADDEADFVLVAHSQGNLFVNAAYDGLRRSHPDTHATVVHVAPASPTVRGGYGLSDLDLVINGLRVQGVSSVQPSNWSIPFSKVDASGHTLVATYLDGAREGRAKVKALIDSALGSL
jgi:hypothetical protein